MKISVESLNRVSLRLLRQSIATILAAVAIILGGSSLLAQTPPTRFAVIGDYGGDLIYEADVANLIRSWGVDFIITTGDNNYDFGEASTIDRNIGKHFHEFIYPYLGSYGAGADVNRFFPSLGNHDWGDGYVWPPTVKPFTDYFTLPGNERYYDFQWGPLHMFCVDSDDYEPDGVTPTSVQGQWLQQTMGASSAPWKIVYFHHAPYTSALRGPVTWMQWPFKDWGASIVLSGHQHLYERLLIDGLPYITNGLGGYYKDSFKATPINGSIVRYRDDYGAQLVTAYADSINFRFVTRTGIEIDSYTLTTTYPTAATNLQVSAPSSTQAHLRWVDNASIEGGYSVYRSTDGMNYVLAGQTGVNATSFLDSGLDAGQTYHYVVRAFNLNGESGDSNVATVEIPSASADAPSSLTGQLMGSAQVDLTWTDNCTVETSFSIERSVNGVDFAEIASVPADTLTYTDSPVGPSATYYYRVRVIIGVPGASSNVAAVQTPPAAPAGAHIISSSSGQVVVGWSDQSPDETAFLIERSDDGQNFAPLASVASGSTSYADQSVQTSQSYWYRVRSANAAGASVPSNVALARTPPTAPTNMVAEALSATKIQLTWEDNSSDEDGFTIYRSTNGVSFAAIINVPANSTAYLNFGRNTGTNYWYKVRAYSSAGASTDSNVSATTTPPAPVSPPAVPTNLVATAVSSTQIDLTWTDPATTEDGFYIERSMNGSSWSQIVTLHPNVTSFSDPNRLPNRTYYYRIRSYNLAGKSAYSNVASAKTFP